MTLIENLITDNFKFTIIVLLLVYLSIYITFMIRYILNKYFKNIDNFSSFCIDCQKETKKYILKNESGTVKEFVCLGCGKRINKLDSDQK